MLWNNFNNRPIKCLSYQTPNPNEVFFEHFRLLPIFSRKSHLMFECSHKGGCTYELNSPFDLRYLFRSS